MGTLAGLLGDHDIARLHRERAFSLFHESADDVGITATMLELAWVSLLEGDSHRAEQLSRHAMELAEAFDDQALYGRALFLQATAYVDQGDTRSATELFQRSLAIRQRAGDKAGVAGVLLNLGGMYVENDQPTEARRILLCRPRPARSTLSTAPRSPRTRGWKRLATARLPAKATRSDVLVARSLAHRASCPRPANDSVTKSSTSVPEAHQRHPSACCLAVLSQPHEGRGRGMQKTR